MSPEPTAPRALAPAVANFRTTALIIGSALFMEQLDGTILTTALPAMARSFGVDPLHMSVALTSYLLSLAVFIPASGRMADRFGARTVFRGAIGLFTLGSVLSAWADSLSFLVLARLLQGLGGAMMVPVGRLVLLRTVAKSDLVAAMSWLLVPALLGPVLGPPVGGFIVTYFSWRWIFYINLPFGLICMALASRYIADLREPTPGQFDLRGLFLSGISLACLTFGLESASRGTGSLQATAAILATGLVFSALYIRHARRTPEPILDLRLMRIQTFRLSVLGGALTRITAGAVPFLLPMMMQIGFGLSAAQSGTITFMAAAGAMVMKASAGLALRRFGYRDTLIWNGALASCSIALCAAFRPSWPMAAIYAVLLIGGLFQSLQFTAYNTIAYADVPRARMSAATSFYTTFQQLMLSLGICVGATALSAAMAMSGHGQARLTDFSAAFLVVTTISLLASPVCAHLPRNAGDEISGHGQAAQARHG
jgi:EmrB/QacA subfamily drug resistance transporter